MEKAAGLGEGPGAMDVDCLPRRIWEEGYKYVRIEGTGECQVRILKRLMGSDVFSGDEKSGWIDH